MGSSDPRMGTIVLGFTSLACSFTSIIFIRIFSRKFVFVSGHFGVGVAWLMVAYFNYVENSIGVVISMNLFMFFYVNSSGTLAWTYAAETCIDSAIGIVIMSIYVNVIYLAIVCPIILEPSSLGPTKVFIGMSAFSFLGSLYCYCFMRETKGLSD